MSSAFMQPRNFGGAGFGPVVTGPAKRHKVFWRVGLGDRPWNNVVNIQLLPLARKRILQAPAFTASVSIALANGLSSFFPIAAASVMFGGSALPSRACRARLSDHIRGNVTLVTAKSAWFTVKGAKLLPAPFARDHVRFLAAPSSAVIASHIAEPASFGVIGICLKGAAAALTCFRDACLRLPLASRPALVPSGATISASAFTRTVFATCATSEVLTAIRAMMMNGSHVENIRRTCRKNKNFEIACRRVDEATRQPDLFIAPSETPTQEAMDL